jgi:hypothetical protein
LKENAFKARRFQLSNILLYSCVKSNVLLVLFVREIEICFLTLLINFGSDIVMFKTKSTCSHLSSKARAEGIQSQIAHKIILEYDDVLNLKKEFSQQF